MPHCGTSTFDFHFDYRLIVFKDVQHSTRTGIRCIWWNVINVCWNDVGVLDWDGVVHVWLDNCRRVSPWLSMPPSVLFGAEWNISISKSQRVRAGIPSMRNPASIEMISASVELCETEVFLLHIQLFDTNLWLSKMHRTPADVNFVSRIQLFFRSRPEKWPLSYSKSFCI